jgi:hypothetical protein
VFEVKTKICQDCVKIEETLLFPCVLCIMDSSQYKDSLMRLETCMVDTDFPILQGFHVKQADIYDNNYYP